MIGKLMGWVLYMNYTRTKGMEFMWIISQVTVCNEVVPEILIFNCERIKDNLKSMMGIEFEVN